MLLWSRCSHWLFCCWWRRISLISFVCYEVDDFLKLGTKCPVCGGKSGLVHDKTNSKASHNDTETLTCTLKRESSLKARIVNPTFRTRPSR